MVKSTAEALDRTFGALADPTRRAILARLATGPLTVGQLAAPLPMSLVAASKHISVLERAGLLTRTRDGRHQICRLSPTALREASGWLDEYRRLTAASGQSEAEPEPAVKRPGSRARTQLDALEA